MTAQSDTILDIDTQQAGQRAWEVFERGRLERIAKGEREWTMDEINEEIAAAHRESANKAKAGCT